MPNRQPLDSIMQPPVPRRFNMPSRSFLVAVMLWMLPLSQLDAGDGPAKPDTSCGDTLIAD